MRPCLPLLVKARAVIANPAKWGKGRRKFDRPCTTYCAAEAIEETAFDQRWIARRGEALNRLRDAIGSMSIVDWNDAPERTHAEVLAAFDKAIALTSGEGA